MRRASVELETETETAVVPAPPSTDVPDGRVRRRTSVRFQTSDASGALSHISDNSLAGPTASPVPGRQRQHSLVLSETGAVLPAPQALQDVLDDATTRHLLTAHRATIMKALTRAADASCSLRPEVFRSTLISLQLFEPKQVDDLVESLLYLGRVGKTHGSIPTAKAPDGTELVCFTLLFHHNAVSASTQDVAPLPPGLVHVDSPAVSLTAAATREAPREDNNKWGDAKILRTQREALGSRFRLPSESEITALDKTDTAINQVTDSQDEESDVEEEDEYEDLTPELKATRIRTLAQNRNQTAQRFRLPSVEELIMDAAYSPGRTNSNRTSSDTMLGGPPGRRRDTMPAVALMDNNGNIAGTLDAYSSIGMIAVFFASLSLTVLSAEDLDGASRLMKASICLMCVVLVLNIFTVLTMSMIYYYGQLHIGHGMSETAAYFIQRNRQLKNLRRWALEAFWASAPLFMVAMGLKFLSQDTDPVTGNFSTVGMVIACIFGAGVVVVVFGIFTVLRAHRSELDFWELAQQESGRASRHHVHVAIPP